MGAGMNLVRLFGEYPRADTQAASVQQVRWNSAAAPVNARWPLSTLPLIVLIVTGDEDESAHVIVEVKRDVDFVPGSQDGELHLDIDRIGNDEFVI